MATTDFVDNVTVSAASWFDDVDTVAYAGLTAVAGTNTITAGGPASMTAYATRQRFILIPAATNTGATTIDITPSGGGALGPKNIFLSGAALTGGELKIGVPCWIIYDGTQFNLTSSSALLRSKVVGFTRDLTTATGMQAVTGVGFTPRAVITFGAVNLNGIMSIGVADSAFGGAALSAATTAGTYTFNTTTIYISTAVGTDFQTALVQSYDADGFTLAWTKTGTPSGTAQFYALCLR